MSKKIKAFIEFEKYSLNNLTSNEIALLRECDYFRTKKKVFYFSAVGIVILNEIILVIFPKNTEMPNFMDFKKRTRILYNALLRYKMDNNLDSEENELLGGSLNDGNNQLTSALWILKDFVVYGFVDYKRKRYSINTGSNHDWPKTIRTQQPLISDEVLLYNNIVTYSFENNSNLIYQLHEFCVVNSYNEYGWLLDFQIDSTDPIPKEMPCSIEMANHVITNELNRAFSDRYIHLLKNMYSYLNSSELTCENFSISSFVTDKFENVWEKICQSLIYDTRAINKPNLPSYLWNISSSFKYSKQIPDLIVVRKNLLFIGDAKYYSLHDKLPTGGALAKQFMYGLSLRQYALDYKLLAYNVLIFNSEHNDRVKYHALVTMVDSNNPLTMLSEFGEVHSVTLDTEFALISYGDYKTNNLIDDIISLI